jgi:hypothetical protein
MDKTWSATLEQEFKVRTEASRLRSLVLLRARQRLGTCMGRDSASEPVWGATRDSDYASHRKRA